MTPISPFENRTTYEVIQKIIYDSRKEISKKQITKNVLSRWRDSKTIIDMKTAHRYYKVENEEIEKKTRDYVDINGVKQQNLYVSNEKLASAYLRNSVNQKVDYAFGKPFILEVIDTSQEDKQKESADSIAYTKRWLEWLDDAKLDTISRTATDAINKGIGWTHPYIDKESQLQIMDIEPETAYPIWRNKTHRELDALVRDYSIIQYEVDDPEEIHKVEYWDNESVEKYIEINGELIPDILAEHIIDDELVELTDSVIKSHFKIGEEGASWGRVPFIDLKGNDDELPLLNVFKSYLDAYDQLTSKSVDTIKDDIDAVIVLKEVSPEVGSLSKARQILQTSRIVSVEKDGDVGFIKVESDITAIETKLASLENAMRKATSTIDIAESKFGLNPSGEALKALYQELDTYVNRLEKKFRTYIKKLKYFFDKWQEMLGYGTVEQFEKYTLNVRLDRDMLIHETSLIQNTAILSGLVSQETLDGYNPAVIDHKTEQARREQEQEALRNSDELQQLRDILTDNERKSV